jgi:hypothetical protein
MTLIRKAAAVSTAVLAALLLSAPAHAADGDLHGCALFGAGVAGLAQTLGSGFGAAASGVATSGPAALPTTVVHPEQQLYCQ